MPGSTSFLFRVKKPRSHSTAKKVHQRKQWLSNYMCQPKLSCGAANLLVWQLNHLFSFWWPLPCRLIREGYLNQCKSLIIAILVAFSRLKPFYCHWEFHSFKWVLLFEHFHYVPLTLWRSGKTIYLSALNQMVCSWHGPQGVRFQLQQTKYRAI